MTTKILAMATGALVTINEALAATTGTLVTGFRNAWLLKLQ